MANNNANNNANNSANNSANNKANLDSPFHQGEQAIQTRLGVRDKMERFGRKVIRDFMPEQHRAFYQQLPFIFAGHADSHGRPWASILFNDPGFIASPDDKTLHIHAMPVKGDPLADALTTDTRVGLLGIELTTRRRNRLAAHISAPVAEGNNRYIPLTVDQSFGNCPQYIQLREIENLDSQSAPEATMDELTDFDQRAQALIKRSDTFFVASAVTADNFNNTDNNTDTNTDTNTDRSTNNRNDASLGADVSHRGGKPGFVRIDNNKTLTIPDYLGNFHFNTLGNFIKNPKAGLLFIDFEHGHLLSVTGTVEIIWDCDDTEYFAGAERLWRFHIEQGRWINHGLPLRWTLDEYSVNTLLTGTWDEAEQLRQADSQKNQWMPYKLIELVEESSVIKSFYLAPQGHSCPPFLSGQFLTLKVTIEGVEHIRTYTVSSCPADRHYRISVKRETSTTEGQPEGLLSNFLHDELAIGDTVECKAPCGAFTFDAAVRRPAVLLSGGVGITPMVSMARHALMEGQRTRYIRPLTIISAARDIEQRAFFDELNDIADLSNGQIRTFWALSQVDSELKAGKDFHHSGRITAKLIQAVLPLDDYDFYLCGPAGFMQSMYNLLRQLGVSDGRIEAEAFGPAALVRDEDEATSEFHAQAQAEEAIVEFSDSKVEQAWSKGDGNLLDFAESHGFNPDYGCRSGQCGACKCQLLAGKVAYQSAFTAEVADDEVLLCCATPAAVEGEAVVKVVIKL